ncbi:MAG: class I SAM-dependent methyltransferase [Pseudomonadota bacterium]
MGKLKKSLWDAAMVPFLYPSALLMKKVRRMGVHKLPLCRRVLMQVGVFPIRDHFYEPLFNEKYLMRPLSEPRHLPGIVWNVDEQLALLESFAFAEELQDIPEKKHSGPVFYMGNGVFGPGDAEYWYSMIRSKKPRTIIEVGSGYSTLMAIRAVKKNQSEDSSYRCKHICIEPFKKAWLEETGVVVLRNKVEEVEKDVFLELRENDILFIDSSHIIRPQGDVLLEYLELLPSLNKGVIVHIHDIFSPRDYPAAWVKDRIRFWNEQYLLEAFLTHNQDWKIIGALNLLQHSHHQRLKATCPFLMPDTEPGSFYIQKKA